jgi:F0F1-type ATP synthase epsilon subunit
MFSSTVLHPLSFGNDVMKIQILDPQQVLFEGAVAEATLPGAEGELTILDDHEPLFVVLKRGRIRLTPLVKATGAAEIVEIRPIRIRRGMARMRNNELVVFVE